MELPLLLILCPRFKYNIYHVSSSPSRKIMPDFTSLTSLPPNKMLPSCSATLRHRLFQHPLRSLTFRHVNPPYLLSLSPQIRHNSSQSSPSRPHVIFSGIQPTGIPHLGNYLGALQNWVKLQNEAKEDTKLLYSIVDLHAITIPQNPGDLRRWKREALATLLAVGLREERCVMFFQSEVSRLSFCLD